MEKPCRLRTEGGLNEHLGRHESVTGPLTTTAEAGEFRGMFTGEAGQEAVGGLYIEHDTRFIEAGVFVLEADKP